jgi:streptomycin 6-kinase
VAAGPLRVVGGYGAQVIGIPDALARGTVEREGQPGAAWLAVLPEIIADLLDRWACVPDGEARHGQVAIVVPVRRAGDLAVLKVSFPHPGNVHEPDALAAWAGRGAVLLHEHDDERFALLLERASTATLAAVPDGDTAAMLAGRLTSRLAIPAPAGMPRLAEQAADWAGELSADAARWPRALPAYAVDAAAATARDLGSDQPDLIIHGDLHAGNILRAEREPWLAIDPKGCAGDPAYDAGMPIKWRSLRLLPADELRGAARRLLDIYADAAELDRERVRRWAQFHAVRAALWGRGHGFGAAGAGTAQGELTEFADHLAELLATPPRQRPA